MSCGNVRIGKPIKRNHQTEIDPQRLIFLEETWTKTNLTRRYGRSPQGQPLREKTPCGRWKTTTFLGALCRASFVAPVCVEGAINGRIFLRWIEQQLVPTLLMPTLKPGDIVVLDNLSGAGQSERPQDC